MKSQIYTHSSIKELHKKQLNEFVWPFYNKILPQFTNIDSEADRVSEDYWKKVMSRAVSDGNYDDPGMYADTAIERGLEHYMMLKLGLYTVTAAWHATLFEFFYQQIRLFLHSEISHLVKIEIKDFCGDFKSVIDFFSFHNFDITSLSSWSLINEMRCLCNVIKHGDGYSSDKLRKLAPHRFKDSDGTDLFKLYKTTLIEETLNINGDTLIEYKNAAEEFWNELPERCYSDDIKNNT